MQQAMMAVHVLFLMFFLAVKFIVGGESSWVCCPFNKTNQHRVVCKAFYFPGRLWVRSDMKFCSYRNRECEVRERFAAAVRSSVETLDPETFLTALRDGKLPHANKAVQTTIIGGDENDVRMEALLLPRDLILPTFEDFRQSSCGAPNLLCLRNSSVLDRQHRADTVSHLRKDRSGAIAWVGHSGIGKSAEVNAVVIELLQNMGQPGWPTKLAHRVAANIYVYQLNGTNGQVMCSLDRGESGTFGLDRLNDFCWKHSEEEGWALILELGELEKNPDTCMMPTLLAISSRRGRERLMDLDKSFRLKMFIRGPHLPVELLIMARLIYLVDPTPTLWMARFDLATTEEEFVSEMAVRVKDIGPLVRNVLNGFIYQDFSWSRRACKYSCDLAELNYDNLPGNSKYIMAQHPVGNTQRVYGGFKYKLLSSTAASDLCHSVRSVDSLQTLQMTGLAQQIVEARLLEAMRDPSYDYSEWQRFRDPGCNAALTSRHRLPFHILRSTQEVCSDTAYTSKDARSMVDGCAYRAVVASDGLGSFYCYTAADSNSTQEVTAPCHRPKSHNDHTSGGRWITVLQTADQEFPPVRVRRSPVNMTAVRSFFEAHKLWDEDSCDVKVRLVGVVSSLQPLRAVKGMKFVDGTGREMTIAEVWEHYPEYAGRLHTEFIRAPLSWVYPNLAKRVSVSSTHTHPSSSHYINLLETTVT
jgi:hypothetical protein